MNDTVQAASNLRTTVEGVIARLQTMQEIAERADPEASSDRLTAITEEVHELGAEVERTAATVSAAGERAAEGMAALQASVVSAAGDSLEGGETAVQALDDQCDELSAAVAQTRESFAAAVAQLTQATRNHAEQFKAAARESLFEPLRENFSDAMERGDSSHLSQLDSLLSEVEASVERLADLLVEALTALGRSLSDATDGSSAERAALEPALDAVQVVLDPLLEQVERVKDLASMVGIDV